MVSVVRFWLALPAADAPSGIKAAAAVSADPFITKFKKSLRELMVSFAFLSVARCSLGARAFPNESHWR
jgi:hypothetical protein